MTINGQTVQDVLIAIGLLGGTLLYYKGRVPQQTIKNLTEVNASYVELNSTYEKRIKALELQAQDDKSKHLENTKSIARLQGQIDLYKELPLRELADGIKEVAILTKDNAESNKAILNQLKATAGIAAEDRSVLTNSDKHIHDEVQKALKK